MRFGVQVSRGGGRFVSRPGLCRLFFSPLPSQWRSVANCKECASSNVCVSRRRYLPLRALRSACGRKAFSRRVLFFIHMVLLGQNSREGSSAAVCRSFRSFCVGCVLMVFPNDGTTFSVLCLLSRWWSAVAAAPQNNVISSAAEIRSFHSFASAVHWWLCLMI